MLTASEVTTLWQYRNECIIIIIIIINLTKVQSREAYEHRCRRRAAMASQVPNAASASEGGCRSVGGVASDVNNIRHADHGQQPTTVTLSANCKSFTPR